MFWTLPATSMSSPPISLLTTNACGIVSRSQLAGEPAADTGALIVIAPVVVFAEPVADVPAFC